MQNNGYQKSAPPRGGIGRNMRRNDGNPSYDNRAKNMPMGHGQPQQQQQQQQPYGNMNNRGNPYASQPYSPTQRHPMDNSGFAVHHTLEQYPSPVGQMSRDMGHQVPYPHPQVVYQTQIPAHHTMDASGAYYISSNPQMYDQRYIQHAPHVIIQQPNVYTTQRGMPYVTQIPATMAQVSNGAPTGMRGHTGQYVQAINTQVGAPQQYFTIAPQTVPVISIPNQQMPGSYNHVYMQQMPPSSPTGMHVPYGQVLSSHQPSQHVQQQPQMVSHSHMQQVHHSPQTIPQSVPRHAMSMSADHSAPNQQHKHKFTIKDKQGNVFTSDNWKNTASLASVSTDEPKAKDNAIEVAVVAEPVLAPTVVAVAPTAAPIAVQPLSQHSSPRKLETVATSPLKGVTHIPEVKSSPQVPRNPNIVVSSAPVTPRVAETKQPVLENPSTPAAISGVSGVNIAQVQTPVSSAEQSQQGQVPASKSRSLRPGGGASTSMKLNSGPVVKPQRLVYNREFVLKNKPVASDCPTYLAIYASILGIDVTSLTPATATKPRSRSMSQTMMDLQEGINAIGTSNDWKRDVRNSTTSTPPQYSNNSNTNSNSGPNNGSNNSSNRPTRRDQPNSLTASPSPPSSQPYDTPLRRLMNPLDAFSQEIRSILNKITPQTFEKLCGQIKSIPLPSSAFCDRLVDLIFEKAIFEQNFSNLYADMCLDLENHVVTSASFLHGVFFRESNQFSWIKDVETDLRCGQSVNGPVASLKDYWSSSHPTTLITNTLQAKLQLNQLIISGNTLYKVYAPATAAAGSVASAPVEYYICSQPLSDLNERNLSDQRFQTVIDAMKNGRKRNSIKAKLLSLCQTEFMESSNKAAKYEAVAVAKSEFNRRRPSMTCDEIEMEQVRIDELQDKLKRRMLGTIRFIGELFKKGLVIVPAVMSCFAELLCISTAESNPIVFKPPNTVQDIDIEVLCRLIHTVGKELESQLEINSPQTPSSRYAALYQRAFEDLFKFLDTLSRDKGRTLRIRFSIEECLELRANNWQERKVFAEEGPLKLDEIHRRAEAEYRNVGPTATTTGTRSRSNSYTSSSANNTSKYGGNQSSNTTPQAKKSQQRSNSFISPNNSNSAMKRSLPPSGRSGTNIANVPAAERTIESIQTQCRSILNDYLSSYCSDDTIEVLSAETTFDANVASAFLLLVWEKFLDSNKAEVMSRIEELISNRNFVTLFQLGKVREALWKSMKSFEPLITLCDYVVDNKLAPQRMGLFFRILIQSAILQQNDVIEYLGKLRQENLEYASEEEVEKVFNTVISLIRQLN